MSSIKIIRNQLETLFFVISMKLATPKDFELLIYILNIPKYKHSLDFYSKINNYFIIYYSKNLRKYAQTVLQEKRYSHLLTESDRFYLKCESSINLLKLIKEQFLLGNKDGEILNKIKFSIENLLRRVDNKEHIPEELIFYLYIVSKIQTQQENAIKQAEQMLKHIKHTKNVIQIMNLNSELNLSTINENKILKILYFYMDSFNIENYIYIMVIEIFRYITYPIYENKFLNQLQNFFNNSKLITVHLIIKQEVLEVCFELIESMQFHNHKLFFKNF